MIDVPTTCPKCGAPLQQELLGGKCPACISQWLLGEETTSAFPELQGGREFGDYMLAEEIGRGGMGVVYRAWQPALQRYVALKLLIGGAFADATATSRFQREAELAAKLQHPGILPIHEAGIHDGQPFYVMELVVGESLADRLRQGALSSSISASLMERIANAVAYAHQQGVIHRDLKPSNILLDEHGGVKVADFGLAMASGQAEISLTRSTDVMGSPPYMAPEMIEAGANKHGTAGDIYALGAILYHALTGRPPFQGESVAQILSQVTNALPIPPRRIYAGVARDLETICLKCLEKNPEHRFESAADLVADLRRFQNGDPVKARPIGPLVQGWRWIKRRPAFGLTLLALFVSLIVGTTSVMWQARENEIKHRQLEATSLLVRREAYASGIISAASELRDGNLTRTRELLLHEPGAGDQHFQDFEWHWLSQQAQDASLAVLKNGSEIILSTIFSANGDSLFTGDQASTLRQWNVAEKTLTGEWQLPGQPFTMQLSPDGNLLYIGTGNYQQPTGVVVWDLAMQKELRRYPGSIANLSRDGKWLATVDSDFYFYWKHGGNVRILNATDGALQREWKGAYRFIALHPSGQSIAMSTGQDQLQIADVTTGEVASTIALTNGLKQLCYSPNGDSLIAAFENGAVLVYPHGNHNTSVSLPHRRGIWGMAFSPDGNTLATTGSDYILRLWNPKQWDDPPVQFLGSKDEIWCAAFHPSEPIIATAGKGGDSILWGMQDRRSRPQEFPHHSLRSPILSEDGGAMVTCGQDGTFDLRMLGEEAVKQHFPASLRPVWLSAQARTAACIDAKEKRVVWKSLVSDQEINHIPWDLPTKPSNPHFYLKFTPDGRHWVAWDGASALNAWATDAPTGEATYPLPEAEPGNSLRDGNLAISDDGKLVAWCSSNHSVAWLLKPHQPAIALTGHTLGMTRMAFSPDETILATANEDHFIRLWDTQHGQCLRILPGHWTDVDDVCFSPSGKTLASISTRDSLKLWQVASGKCLLEIRDTSLGQSVQFTPDGKSLMVGLHTYDSPLVAIRILAP